MTKKPGPYQNIHQMLIERCKRGEKSAQFEIYKLYYKSMYNTSVRIVGNAEDAEDIMQESFLSAFLKLNEYQGEVSFGAWLKRIVINRSVDYLRKRKIEWIEIAEAVTIKQEETTGEEEEAEIKVEAVKQAIKILPDGYRVILSLYLLEGYDHGEIAEILEISGSTSRSQYARARKRLVEILKQKSIAK